MTLIFVLLTIAAFLTFQYYIERRRRANAHLARARSPTLRPVGNAPVGLLLHAGHTWVQVHDEQLVSIGSTDFAVNFAGSLSRIMMPREGTRLKQGQNAWTLVSSNRRRLSQVMPIDGKIVAVNSRLLDDPSLAQQSPYDGGWLLRVKPRNMARHIGNLMAKSSAESWVEGIRTKVTARLSPALGTLALDGGDWETGFGDRLDNSDWEALRQELFPATE